MGNRAVIQMKGSNVGIYLHYNGGRDSVEGFLTYCKLRGFRGDDYGIARLTQVIANFFGGDLSIGIDTVDRLDCDNDDNGVYVIDDKFDIVERKYAPNKEQHNYNLFGIVNEINECQPQRDQLNLNDEEVKSRLNEIYCQLNGIEQKDKRFEELKKAIFNMGHTDYIEEFLGYEISFSDYSKDAIDNLMDEVYQQMPNEKLEEFYAKYCI